MTWEVGQQVQCDGIDWGVCQVTMSSDRLVVIHCSRHHIVMTGTQPQLEAAGWQPIHAPNLIWLEAWAAAHKRRQAGDR